MADDTTGAKRWQGRPVLAWATRIVIFVVPFLAAMTVAFLLSSQLPIASALPVRIVRWLAIVAVSTLAMMGVDRLARRLLPLSVLLKLTLVFPDHAPSRFGVAMRTGTTAQLRKRLDAAREVPSGETAQEAAERLLELVGLLSHHDRLTRGHSERVRAYSHLIGEELGLTGAELDKLRWAALLHDVGKTAIDTTILNKAGRLTNDEFATIKTHPDEGRELVAPLADWLGESIQAVWQHHERFDGRGYPQGLSGTSISFAARVVSVADSYDVMTSARSYKKPMSADAARAELATCSGTQFDPIMVRAFLNVSLGRLRVMTGPLAWFAQLALFEPHGVVHASALSTQSGGSGTAGGSVGAASGAGSAASAAGSSAVSTATAAAASTGSAGVVSTMAATAASVVASTVGIAAATPVVTTPFADAAAPTTIATQRESNDLPPPADTVLSLDTGAFSTSDRNAAASAIETASARMSADEPPATTTTMRSDVATPPPTGTTTTPTTTEAANSSPTPTATTTTAPTTTAPTTTPPTTTPPSPVVPTTTAPTPVVPTTIPPTTTTPAEPTTTTTTPPSTTTTTTVPPPTTTTTTTATTTTTTTVTTVAPATTPVLYLGGGVIDGIPAPAFHGISIDQPADISLANFDTDRDDAPGALVQRDAAGINGTEPANILTFRGALAAPFVIDDDLHIELHAAAQDFARVDIDVEVGLYRCTVVDQCTLLGSDIHDVKNADRWKKTKFHFHDLDTTIGVDEWIEVRVAVLENSEAHGWFAFGTQEFDAKITVGDED